MADIKTRILLRNDTLANWEAAGSVTLKKGEVGIAMLTGEDAGLAELRIGNNTTWANSKKLRVEAGQISGLIDTINTQINSLAYEYQLTAGTGDDLNKWFLQSRHLSGGDSYNPLCNNVQRRYYVYRQSNSPDRPSCRGVVDDAGKRQALA